MSERHPVAAAAVEKALRDFETRAGSEDILKLTDYVRLFEELEEMFVDLPANITVRWE